MDLFDLERGCRDVNCNLSAQSHLTWSWRALSPESYRDGLLQHTSIKRDFQDRLEGPNAAVVPDAGSEPYDHLLCVSDLRPSSNEDQVLSWGFSTFSTQHPHIHKRI